MRARPVDKHTYINNYLYGLDEDIGKKFARQISNIYREECTKYNFKIITHAQVGALIRMGVSQQINIPTYKAITWVWMKILKENIVGRQVTYNKYVYTKYDLKIMIFTINMDKFRRGSLNLCSTVYVFLLRECSKNTLQLCSN